MTAHPTLKDALHEAVAAAGQSDAVARRLEAWLDALSSGSLDLTKDREETITRMNDVLDAIQPRGSQG